MTKFSEVPAAGITIRESANDGSDFTNPSADYRRLFLGEDGYLHVKDSAGTVSDPYTGSSGAVATDAIWDAAGDLAVGSGANTAAKLTKGSAGGALSIVNSAVAWNSGTSFPGSVATGDRYWRTDLGMEFYYDGTRWVSVSLHALTMTTRFAVGSGFAATQTSIVNLVVPHTDVYVTTCRVVVFIASANTGSAFWTVELFKLATNNATTSLGSFSTGTGPDANTTWTPHDITVNAALNAATYPVLRLDGTKTSTPGSLTLAVSCNYRVIAT